MGTRSSGAQKQTPNKKIGPAPDYSKLGFYAAVVFGSLSLLAAYHLGFLQLWKSNSSPSNSTVIDVSRIVSPKGIYYTQLSECIGSGNLRAADQETAEILRRIFNSEGPDKIPSQSFLQAPLPCADLKNLDWIWGQVGGKHKFGFTAQIRIWNALKNVEANEKKRYPIFAIRVGWRDPVNGGKYLDPDKLTYNFQAPTGHLPSVQNMGMRGFYGQFLDRLDHSCWMTNNKQGN